MAKVSVVMSARGEKYLQRTIDNLFDNLTGDFEIIVIQDGPPYQTVEARDKLTVINGSYQGLYPNLNQAAKLATGKYLLKFDSHVAVSKGIDEVMASSMQDNWLMIPRFYTLDGKTWQWQDGRFCDYWKAPCPLTDPKGYRFQASGYWRERTLERLKVGPLDETMFMHGSGWMVERNFFLNEIGGAESEGYGNMFMEPAQFCFKYWLGPWDGRVMVNKDCWYAHLHKHPSDRGYGISMREVKRSYLWTANYWMRNRWPGRKRDIAWLIDRFAPIPGWPDNWIELQDEYERANS